MIGILIEVPWIYRFTDQIWYSHSVSYAHNEHAYFPILLRICFKSPNRPYNWYKYIPSTMYIWQIFLTTLETLNFVLFCFLTGYSKVICLDTPTTKFNLNIKFIYICVYICNYFIFDFYWYTYQKKAEADYLNMELSSSFLNSIKMESENILTLGILSLFWLLFSSQSVFE